MSTALGLDLTPQLGMRVSPALLAFVEVLVLPAVELEALVAREVDENPALELGEPLASGPPAGVLDGAALAADESSVAEQLLAEVRLTLARGDVPIADYLLGNLDEHGFSDLTFDEVAGRLGVERSRVDRVVAALRDVGPPALGARDLRECLLLQLERMEREDRRDLRLARAVVSGHLPALARRAYREIAAATGAGREQVAAVRDLLRAELTPYPLANAGPAVRPPPLVPDVVICERAGELAVEVRAAPAVGLSAQHARLAAHDDGVRRDVERARALLGRLDERRATLRRVAATAVARQADFVRHGPAHLRPLTRSALASELGLHESTVGRAVTGKHVGMPDGHVIPFGDFFGAALPARDALARIIAAEPRPLSDGELAEALAGRGYRVARRTVAKYRDGMGILPRALR